MVLIVFYLGGDSTDGIGNPPSFIPHSNLPINKLPNLARN
jgi:hypothetical protein